MLSFLYLSAVTCSIPILESDILKGAQCNQFGYLTAYKNLIPTESNDFITPNEPKITVLFRPINVPFKNKWLRDSVRDLE